MTLVVRKPITYRTTNNIPTAAPLLADRLFNDLALKIGRDVVNQNPRVNVFENDTAYNIQLATPGLDKQDFQLTVEDDVLTIAVKKEGEGKENDKTVKFLRKEFSYTDFQRNFQLPEDVNKDEIRADYDRGILHVIIPKKVNTPVRRTIEVA